MGGGGGNSEPHLDTPWLATPLSDIYEILNFLIDIFLAVSRNAANAGLDDPRRFILDIAA